MKSPIFVSGLSKSGTSMVKTLFDGHPDLFVVPPNEMLFFFFSEYFPKGSAGPGVVVFQNLNFCPVKKDAVPESRG